MKDYGNDKADKINFENDQVRNRFVDCQCQDQQMMKMSQLKIGKKNKKKIFMIQSFLLPFRNVATNAM